MTAPASPVTPLQQRLRTLPYTLAAAAMFSGSALATGTWTLPSTQQAGGINPEQLNAAVRSGLQSGRNTGAVVACTGVGVFLAQPFMQWVLGGLLLISIFGALFAWLGNQKGNGPGKAFIVLIVVLAVIAVAGFLFVQVMGCQPGATDTNITAMPGGGAPRP